MAQSEHAKEPAAGEGQTRLTGSAALRLHLTLALGLAICAGAFCIEVLRALGGNKLSWVYVFEWPLLGGFGIYMWWSLLTGRDRRERPSKAAATCRDFEDYEKLEAWNRYVRELDAVDNDGPDRAP